MNRLDLETFKSLDRSQAIPDEVDARVAQIFADVRANGDVAVRRLAKELDGFEGPLFLEDWTANIEPALAKAIEGNWRRIRAFHEAQVGREVELETAPGLRLGRRAIPYESVVCYVPGGRAAYPSTVLMTVTLAKLAGVRDIIVMTPNPAPSVVYAAKLAGATRLLQVGGAHGIAAAALGTESIPKVQAIVGPGNAYVTAAKARAQCRTDAPAGPSELLVLADASAKAEPIAWDLLAQAEHDPDAQVVLVTPSESLAMEVEAMLATLAPACKRASIIQAALENSIVVVADSWDDAIDACNAYGPEHLEIFSDQPEEDLARIVNAGSIFLGENTPVSLGDYGSGTNHVLPTMGLASLRGGLCVDDFRKWITWQYASKEALATVSQDICTLADAEGLEMHAEAVRRRL